MNNSNEVVLIFLAFFFFFFQMYIDEKFTSLTTAQSMPQKELSFKERREKPSIYGLAGDKQCASKEAN